MTHYSKLAILGLAITLGATAVANQADARGARADFATLDANSDGQITREEMQAHRAARFTAADTNQDGLISLEELQAQSTERALKRAARMLDHLDANDDGQLSADEMAQGRRGGPDRMFNRIDADDDGVITQAEFDAVQDKMEKRRKP